MNHSKQNKARLILLDNNGQIISINSTFSTLLGISLNDLEKSNIHDICPVINYKSITSSNINNNIPKDVYFLHKNGQKIHCNLTPINMPNYDSNIICLSVNNFDNNDIKTSNDFSQNKIEIYNQTLADLIRNPNVSNGNYLKLLSTFTKKISLATGVSRVSVWLLHKLDSLEYLECLDLWDDDNKSHTCGTKLLSTDFPNYFKAFKSDRTLKFDDVTNDSRIKEFNNEYFPINNISSMLDAPFYFSGEIAGVVCLENTGTPKTWSLSEESFIISATDIISIAFEASRRIKQESELNQIGKIDAINQLSGRVAHDFNNILGIIIGYAELLKNSKNINSKEIGFLDEISTAADRGAKLTKNLLTFSKNTKLSPESIDINNFIISNQDKLIEVISSNIQLQLLLSDNLDALFIDPDFLLESLFSLCKNSSLAIEFNGDIKILTNNVSFDDIQARLLDINPGRYVSIEVKDSGIGMDMETMDKVFIPFFSHQDKSRTGLGLSQIYAGIEKCNGRITVSSQLGKGSKITLLFPSSSAKLKIKSNDSTVDLLKGLNVLVLDDELALLKITNELLEKKVCNVFIAQSVKQALSLLEQKPIDILISDIVMPEMNGVKFAKLVQEKFPKIKIQLMSGFHDFPIENELINSALSKPIDKKKLIQKLIELVE